MESRIFFPIHGGISVCVGSDMLDFILCFYEKSSYSKDEGKRVNCSISK